MFGLSYIHPGKIVLALNKTDGVVSREALRNSSNCCSSPTILIVVGHGRMKIVSQLLLQVKVNSAKRGLRMSSQ